jgi:hypothetical protein
MRPSLSLRVGLLAGLLGSLAACGTRLVMTEIPGARNPTTTIHYAGVRTTMARFPDYSGVDRRILGEAP